MISVIDEVKRTKAIATFHSILSGSWKQRAQSISQAFENAVSLAFNAGLDIRIPFVETQGLRFAVRARVLRDWCARSDCPTWQKIKLFNTNREHGTKRLGKRL